MKQQQYLFKSVERNRLCSNVRKLSLTIFAAFLFSGVLIAQTVTGNVNSKSGPVIGATVLVKGTSTGTATDIDGNFSINANGGDTLIFSYVGYIDQTIPIAGNSVVNIDLIESAVNLDEVVVIGYGTRKKIDVTGAVASLNVEKATELPNTNIAQFLQGTLPGLNVGVATTAGGTPPISVRGRVSLNGNQNVLIILDGVQYNGSLSSINPDDVASIDVLKDASSTAIYGAQAANGVILITSRRGRTGDKPRISFNSSYTISNPTVGDNMTPYNREEFLESVRLGFYDEAFLAPDFTQPNSAFKIASRVDATMALTDRSDVLPNNYNWSDEATNQGGIFENNLSISGGTDKVAYLLSGGFVNQKGYIINDKFQRSSLRANLDITPNKWLKFGLTSSGSFVNQDGAEPSFGVMNIMSPLVVPFDADGNIIPNPTNTVVPNPFNTYYVDNLERHQYLFANVYGELSIPFIKGLSYRVNFGNNGRNDRNFTASQFGGNLTGSINKNYDTYNDYTLDNIVNYVKDFGNSDIEATLLYGAIERRYENVRVGGTGFSRLNLSYNELGGATNRTSSSFSSREALAYQMARASYKLLDKYLVTATVRRDGFSAFSANNKSAIFPTVSAGWIVSNEKFLKQISQIDFLKFRVGYGVVGNQTPALSSQALVGVFAGEHQNYVFGNSPTTAFGQQVNTLGNDDLKWERTAGLNIGADFGFFNERFSGSVEYYNNNTYDLLFSVPLPNLTGFGSIQSNVGQLRNSGFEASLIFDILRAKDFSWNTTFNIWSNANKIIKLSGADNNNDGIEDDIIATGTGGLYIGKSINTIFDYQAGPIYQLGEERLPGFQTGSLSVVDVNGDNVINAEDRQFLGSLEPKYRFSLMNNFNYKNLTLSVFLNAIQGDKDSYLVGGSTVNGNFVSNTRIYFRDDNAIRNNDLRGVDYWSPLNPGGKYPRVISGTRSTVEPTLYERRNFVRLQDVSLSYNLAGGLFKKLKAQNMNVFVSGKNLLTFTDFEGWDPETGQGMITDGRPVLRSYTFGLRVTY